MAQKFQCPVCGRKIKQEKVAVTTDSRSPQAASNVPNVEGGLPSCTNGHAPAAMVPR
jgi:hypothetical protein